ncbi:MAG: hypothetical protein K2Q22_15915, partial [Cytophagales bacterium]|nr:hypothetical protein [Cytophagales bacterium]
KLYKINRTTKQIDTTNLLTMPSNLTWSIPSFAQYSSALAIFDIATINSTGLATIKANASAGFSTGVHAYIPGTGVGGAALITINVPGLNGGLNTATIPGGN